MEQKLEFVPLSAGHISALARLDETAPDPWSAEQLAAELEKPESRATVALLAGEPAAFACFSLWGDTADLSTVTVDAARRNRGVGHALLCHCLCALKKEGAQRVVLEVRCSNAPALALYRRLGFTTLACRRGLYTAPKEDGFLMECKLTRGEK